jgi:hypothetical protein
MQHLLNSAKPLTAGIWRHDTDCKCSIIKFNVKNLNITSIMRKF